MHETSMNYKIVENLGSLIQTSLEEGRTVRIMAGGQYYEISNKTQYELHHDCIQTWAVAPYSAGGVITNNTTGTSAKILIPYSAISLVVIPQTVDEIYPNFEFNENIHFEQHSPEKYDWTNDYSEIENAKPMLVPGMVDEHTNCGTDECCGNCLNDDKERIIRAFLDLLLD